jgi:ATP-dependent DNA helicase RecQ
MDDDCGFCDNCKRARETFEGLELATKVLQAAQQTNERFRLDHLVSVLIGEKTDYVESYQHDKLPIFGQGADQTAKTWVGVIRQSMIKNFLEKDIESYGVLKLTSKGLDFLDAPYSIDLFKDHDFDAEVENEQAEIVINAGIAHDEKLFELLKAERKKVARSKGLPPYVIFQDPSLEEMATVYPTTREELAQINGVGMGKVAKFGAPFLKLITTYVEENEIETASDVVVKSSGTRSKVKISIIQQIDRKTDLDEITGNLNISLSELLHEIEQIIYSGTKLNIDYYIHRIMDDEREEFLHDYFMTANSDNIKEALEELEDEDFAEDELRVYRIKFISEHAN